MTATTVLKVTFRVVLVTALFTILGFAIGGLVGVIAIAVMHAGAIPTNMQDAIWFGALPGGALGCVAGFVIITISERRAGRSFPNARN